MIHVIALITAKLGMRDAVLKEMHANVPNVLAEDGCIEYGPAVDTPDVGAFQTKLGPDTFAVMEKWASVDALRAHSAAPHMQAYGARTRDMVAARIIHVLSPDQG